MMVNPDEDSYVNTLNHRTIICKTRKTTTYLKPNTGISLKGAVRFSHLDCQGGNRPSFPRRLRHWL